MTLQEELKQEIVLLHAQKKELQKEIDELEKKLKVTQDIAVKGDITLQCGTVTRIEPQFHLKLDPNLRMDYAGIFAILSTGESNTANRTSFHTRFGPIDIYAPMARVITLWERRNAINLD